MQRLDARHVEIDPSLVHQLAHAIDAVLGGAETVAVMHQRQPVGDGREIERPIERGIAAARDQHVAPAKLFHLAHGIEDADLPS